MGRDVTREELLDSVQKLVPLIRGNADRGEQQRHLADPLVKALQDAGLYHMLVPRGLGGLQVDPLTFYQVIEALARVDGSTGWCMFINGGAPISVAFLGAEAAEVIYGNGARTIMSGTVFPFGRAVPREGGYLVSGHWVYASGCWHSTWHLAFYNVYEEGTTEPRSGPTGAPELVIVHFPRPQMQILDTWDVSGLSATGSHDVEAQTVFVPEAFVWKFGPPALRGAHCGAPLYRFPFLGFFSWPMAAVALGIAQGALDEITAMAEHKAPRLSAGTLRERPLFQTQLAQAVAFVYSARAWLHEIITKVWEKTQRGESASFQEHAEFLLAATNATQSAAAAVELAYTAGGGSANYAALYNGRCETCMP
jgi:alkylation response protein AidB-like acyl-CoA dehydrogenase